MEKHAEYRLLEAVVRMISWRIWHRSVFWIRVRFIEKLWARLGSTTLLCFGDAFADVLGSECCFAEIAANKGDR
jgi:hypothetical protein